MTSEIKLILKRHINKKDAVILGVSGGPDSVFLLQQCLNLAGTYPFKIIVAHINHNLRGKESDEDERFVKKMAKQKGLVFETIKLKPIKKGNIEEEARNHRYRFFNLLLIKHKAKWIVTAHHKNDNIETVLFNLIRGSYLDGLTGMEIASPQRKILRPLLNVSKEEIIKQLKKDKATYRTDKSNFDLRLSRNLLRHKIIPLIKKINSNFENTFMANIALLKETADMINNLTERWLKTNKNLPLSGFLEGPLTLQKKILSKIYKNIHGNSDKFNQKHLAQILAMLNKNRSGLKKEFGTGFFIAVSKDKKNNRCIEIKKDNY
jgi:tRNA(Ile)-lysidine synthase